MMQVSAVIFDFDGTLIDSEYYYFRANAEAFAAYGHEIEEQEYYLHWSILGEGAQGEIDRYQLQHINLNVIKKTSREIYRKICEKEIIPLIEGAEEVLQELKNRGKKIAIASNTESEIIRLLIEKTGMKHLTCPIIGCNQNLRPKPHPDIFLEALNQLNVKANQSLVVEDTIKGLKSSIAAGIPCVISRSSKYPKIDYPGAAKVIDNLVELLNFID